MGLEDFVQLFFMEGLPDLQRVRLGLLKDRKGDKLINDNAKSIKALSYKQGQVDPNSHQTFNYHQTSNYYHHMELTSSIVDFIVDNH